MKRFVAQLNDGNYINVEADAMFFDGTYITVMKQEKLVALLDVGVVLCAHMSDKG